MSLRPSAPRVLQDRSLWPLWAILLLGLVLIGGRGWSAASGPDGARAPGTVRLTSGPDSPVLAGRPGEGATTRGAAGAPATMPERRLAVCDLDRLPAQTRAVVGRIRAGDASRPSGGAVFENSLGLLPPRAKGYYRRYDVPAPESAEASTRAVVTGGGSPGAPQQWFYTWDERDSFCEIDGA